MGPQSQGSITAIGSRRSTSNAGNAEGDAEGRRPWSEGGIPSKLPAPEVLPEQLWGVEAHDRFRLYTTLRCQENEDQLRTQQAKAIKDARNNYNFKLPYACQLCHDYHELEMCSLRGM